MDGHGMPPWATWGPWTQPFNGPSSSLSSTSSSFCLLENIASPRSPATMASQTCETMPASMQSAATTEIVTFNQLCTRYESVSSGTATLTTTYQIITGPSATVVTSYIPALSISSSSQEASGPMTVITYAGGPGCSWWFVEVRNTACWGTYTTPVSDWAWLTAPTGIANEWTTSFSPAEASIVVSAYSVVESLQSTTWPAAPLQYWQYNFAVSALASLRSSSATTSSIHTTFATSISPSPSSTATLPAATNSAAGANATFSNTNSDRLGHDLAIALPLTFFFLTALIVLFTTWRKCFRRTRDTEEMLRRNLLKEAAERAKRKAKTASTPKPKGKHVDVVEASGRGRGRAKSFSTGTTAFSPVVGNASLAGSGMKEVETPTPKSGSIVIGYDSREAGEVSFFE